MTRNWTVLALASLIPAHAETFYKDVLPILQQHCQSCHRPGAIAPMPLLSFKDTKPWAKAMREAVLHKRMPPWFAESGSVRLADDPKLTPKEIATLNGWVLSGAPEGDLKDAPAPIQWTRGWNIRTPNLVLTMPDAVRVPARGELHYQFVILPLQTTEDRWVEAVEIRPGQRGIVHHLVTYIREPGSTWLRDAPVGKPFVRPGVTTSDILAIYAPGQQPAICPPGMAKRIPAGSDIVLQIHYTPNGRSVEDRTSVGLVWAKEPPSKRVLTLQIATTDFRIPAGESNHRVTAYGTLPNDCLLLSLFPHMHLRGKAFEYAIVEPGGVVETLLRVAPYEFAWQLSYRLAEPKLLRKGTRLQCTAWYDNSPNNPRNPDPTVDVAYGEHSRDEMMVGFFEVAVPAWMDKAAFFVR